MSKEKNILFLTMILNLIIATSKLLIGLIFNFTSLTADSLHSFSDFITDIIATIASKIGNKRATKKHPFGYGMIENISNLIIGLVLFLLATFILIKSFNSTSVTIKPLVFLILITSIILKLIIVSILYINGQKLKSNTLLVSAKESSTDLISSVIVLIVSILLLFQDKYPIFASADIIGSIIISIIIYNISLKIIKENIEYLLGVNEENEQISKYIKEVILNIHTIKDYQANLMKIGDYYNLYLTIELDSNITLKQLFNIENKLKKELRKNKFNIKYIEIEVKEFN